MKKINLLMYIVIIKTNLMNINNDKKEKILNCLNNKILKLFNIENRTNEEETILYTLSLLVIFIKGTKKEINTPNEAIENFINPLSIKIKKEDKKNNIEDLKRSLEKTKENLKKYSYTFEECFKD